jgi:ribosomal RNA-processing protein 8
VRSRFGGADASGKEDFRPFLACLSKLGFKLTQADAGDNKMFVTWVLRKESKEGAMPSKAEGLKWPPLKACMYKRR